jgi:hypothetical protein
MARTGDTSAARPAARRGLGGSDGLRNVLKAQSLRLLGFRGNWLDELGHGVLAVSLSSAFYAFYRRPGLSTVGFKPRPGTMSLVRKGRG